MGLQLRWGVFACLFSLPVFATDFAVDTTQDAVDVTPGDGRCATQSGKCSLRAAVMEANALAGADVINVPAGEYRLTLGNTDENAGEEGDLDIWTDITINGVGGGETVINGSANSFRLFHVFVPDTEVVPSVTLQRLSMTQGLEEVRGAIVLSTGSNILLANVDVYKAGLNSSAVYNDRGVLTVEASRFFENARAIESYSGRMQVSDSVFENNAMPARGGAAIQTLSNDIAVVKNSRFIGNTSDRGIGGAIQASGELLVENSMFDGNTSGQGGALYTRSNAYIDNSTFINNRSVVGGAVLSGGPLLVITGSEFQQNSATESGGALYNYSSVVFLTDCQLLENQAESYHGGAVMNYSSTMIIDASTISGNTAVGSGGGVFALS